MIWQTNEAFNMAKQKVIETWKSADGSWTWEVLRKYNRNPANDNKPFARWFVKVKSPFTPQGEMGDEYVSRIKAHAHKVSGAKGGGTVKMARKARISFRTRRGRVSFLGKK